MEVHVATRVGRDDDDVRARFFRDPSPTEGPYKLCPLATNASHPSAFTSTGMRPIDCAPSYVSGPLRFEAGTPNVVGAIGLARALDFVDAVGRQNILRHESNLATLATRALRAIAGVRVLGDPKCRAGIVSFAVDGIHPHDLATIADARGVALRARHHCAEPLLRSMGEGSVVRASFGVHSAESDIDRLVEAVAESIAVLS